MGVEYSVISIDEMLRPRWLRWPAQFAGRKPDTTEENIQARCRGCC